MTTENFTKKIDSLNHNLSMSMSIRIC